MTADENELLRRMEQATARTLVDRNAMDDETAMLRENWLALGKLLSAADREMDKPERIEVVELRRQVAAAGKMPRLVGTGIAVALAIVACWFAALFLRTPAADPGVANQPDKSGSSSLQVPEVASNAADSNAADSNVPVNSPLELAWDDGWDSDLAQTSLAMQLFHGEQPVRDSSMSRLQGEFQELARDFESGSL